MMSAELPTPCFFKQKKFPKKGFDDIVPDYGATINALSRDSSYTVDVVM